MWVNILKKINWVDIFLVILLFRIGYISIRKGLSIEIFKIFGTLSAIYLSLHYYTVFSGYLRSRIGLEKVPLGVLDFISFIFFSALGILFFVILQKLLSRFIKTDLVPELNKGIGFVLGVTRGLLFSSLIIFMLLISNISYLEKSATNSYLARSLLKIAPTTYAFFWNNLFSKYRTRDKFNTAVLEVQRLESAE